jgi:tRNA A37 threonylcarbamoyladenosine dehydratase
MRDRILEINPRAEVTTHQRFYMPGEADDLISTDWDYIVDAIDTVTGKIGLITFACCTDGTVLASYAVSQ